MHRTLLVMVSRIAVTYFLLQFAKLLMPHRAVTGVAAIGQSRSRQRFRQHGNAGSQKREQYRRSQEFSQDGSFSHRTHWAFTLELLKHTRFPRPGASIHPGSQSYWLDTGLRCRQYSYMAYSFLVFDFGGDEEAAQQARHRIEGWRQAFRLDKKLQFKFDRTEQPSNEAATPAAEAKSKPAKGRSAKGNKTASKLTGAKDGHSESAETQDVRFIVRLDFSDHEKLSHERWLQRIPTEAPFKTAHPEIVRADDSNFREISDHFDELHPAEKKNYA